ncbi:MAG: methyltransferase domain-containing protein, partial [Actinobacteria bacterium]|nr:methyltransferase domain-containing protein [Actinomycetota bacterium]
RKRYRQALISVREVPFNFKGNILDYGGGSGEFCKYILKSFPYANVVLYEPTPSIRQEAIKNLAEYPGIKINAEIKDLPYTKFDVIFCMEVFEHMVIDQYPVIFNDFLKLMDRDSLLVLSIPVEIYLPALIKGIFRMTRRYGRYDANIKNIFKCTFGKPPQNRPREEIENSLPYHYDHLGFDYRAFEKELKKHFSIICSYGGPFTLLPAALNLEKYYLCKKSGQYIN